jgi:transposase
MPRKFPREFVDDVVRVARQGEQTLSEVARSFGVSVTSVQRWLAQADVDDGVRPGVSSFESVTVAKLKKRNRRLEQENEILRRAAAFFAKDISPK